MDLELSRLDQAAYFDEHAEWPPRYDSVLKSCWLEKENALAPTQKDLLSFKLSELNRR